MKESPWKLYFVILVYADRRHYTSWLIRNCETAGAVDHKENRDHCGSIEELVIHLDKQGVHNRRVNSLLITQIIVPTRPRNEIKSIARIFFCLPENACVRSMRMTVDQIRYQLVENVTNCAYIVQRVPIIKS